MHDSIRTKEKVPSFRQRSPMFGKVRKLYFVGIGGAGMSGIAEILHNLGFQVAGSDNTPSPVTAYLESLGVAVEKSHAASNLKEIDVVVISSAVGEDNPEVKEARRRGIPVIKRAEMLGELMRLKFSIGVAGTHGKTTTTSMIGRILQFGKYQPTLIVGGVVADLGTGAALGSGDYLVAEADEYDRSILAMFPTVAVVTNIEADHLDCYADMDDLRNSFLTYINRVPFYGTVVLSADDANIATIKKRITRPFSTFGFAADADYRALNIGMQKGRSTFSAYYRDTLLGEIILHVPGRFNVANALGAVATCHQLDVPFTTIADGLLSFRGVERRFEIIGEAGEVLVVDDYAHHPSEIRATLEMAKAVYNRRVVVVYQPHLYSRTQDFAPQFAEALSLADKCILTDIYPAREEPIEGVTSEMIKKLAEKAGTGDFDYVGVKENAVERLAALVRPGDLVITMGAGSITHIKKMILEMIENR